MTEVRWFPSKLIKIFKNFLVSQNVRISRILCMLVHLQSAGSGWLHSHCSDFVRELFRHDHQYHATLLACGSLRPRTLFPQLRPAHGPCVPLSSHPFLCHTSRVCCVFFFISSIRRNGTHYSDCQCYKIPKFGGLFRLRSLCKGSGCSGSSIDRERNVRILCSTPIYCLTNLAPFRFFLVAGNSALITLHPSGFHGLQVPVQPSMLQFHGYVRSMRTRASDAPHFRFSSIF